MSAPDAVVVHPLPAGVRGQLVVPGDKSISHRAFLLGALCTEPVRVTGAADSGDVRSTVAAVRTMGATVSGTPADAVVTGPVSEPADVLDCGNSGTAMRLLAGVCSGLDGLSVLTGDSSLRGRPMDRIAQPLRAMGARVDGRGGGRYAPLSIVGGRLDGIEYRMPVASAQVKSCVLLAGLRASGTTTVLEPGPSRDHTERMLRWLGADAGSAGRSAWVRPGPLTARPLRVPGDPSSAAFWLTAAAVLPGSALRITDVCLNPTRTGVLDVLTAMGAPISVDVAHAWCGEPVGLVDAGAGATRAAHVDGDLVVRAIDELPVLAVAGALGAGLVVTDAGELRVKESDRIAAIARMLRSLGAVVETSVDGFAVRGGARLNGGTVDSGGDHRIAMAAAVAALAADAPVTITGFAAVATSYPTFLTDLTAVGGRWERATR